MNKKFHFVIVEDDHEQEKDLSNEIRLAIQGLANQPIEFHIESISCEAEFLDRFLDSNVVLPDLFVIDLMLEWRQPWVISQRKLPSPPPEMDEAGLRCLSVVRKHSAKVPVLLWTMTNKELRPGTVDDRTTVYLRKDRAVESDLDSVFRRLKLP